MNERIVYIITALGGLFLAVAPQTFLHPCHMEGMACTFMGKTASLIGAIILVLGVAGLLFVREKRGHLAAATAIVSTSVIEALVPTILGYCKMETMSCTLKTVPGIYASSAIVGIVGALWLVYLTVSIRKVENVQ